MAKKRKRVTTGQQLDSLTRELEGVRGLVENLANFGGANSPLPIIHIEQLAKQLDIERRWILDNWVNRQPAVPHFRDGHHVFFNLEQLNDWSKQRAAHAAIER